MIVLWILQATAKGSIAIAIIALAQTVIGRRLHARWWCALWLLALVRLIAPVTSSWRWSLYNLVPIHPAIELQLRASAAIPWWIGAWKWLAIAWLCGVAFFTIRITIATLRTQSLVRRSLESGGATPAAWQIVEDARAQLRIRRHVVVVESPLIDGPALHGVLRPTLLLPEGLCSAFAGEELRHVILHELAHLRRHDIAVNWMLNALRAIHWFNPFVWLAVARIQEERELACDELTLACLRPNERLGYGRTILKLVEHFRRAEPVPALVGIVNRKQQMRRRLMQIGSDHAGSRFMLPIIAILSAIGLMALADAPGGQPVNADSLRTIERFNQPIDLDITNASLSELLAAVEARSGVAVTCPIANATLCRARFTVHASHTSAASLLTRALRSYRIVPTPAGEAMTLSAAPPCVTRHSR